MFNGAAWKGWVCCGRPMVMDAEDAAYHDTMRPTSAPASTKPLLPAPPNSHAQAAALPQDQQHRQPQLLETLSQGGPPGTAGYSWSSLAQSWYTATTASLMLFSPDAKQLLWCNIEVPTGDNIIMQLLACHSEAELQAVLGVVRSQGLWRGTVKSKFGHELMVRWASMKHHPARAIMGALTPRPPPPPTDQHEQFAGTRYVEADIAADGLHADFTASALDPAHSAQLSSPLTSPIPPTTPVPHPSSSHPASTSWPSSCQLHTPAGSFVRPASVGSSHKLASSLTPSGLIVPGVHASNAPSPSSSTFCSFTSQSGGVHSAGLPTVPADVAARGSWPPEPSDPTPRPGGLVTSPGASGAAALLGAASRELTVGSCSSQAVLGGPSVAGMTAPPSSIFSGLGSDDRLPAGMRRDSQCTSSHHPASRTSFLQHTSSTLGTPGPMTATILHSLGYDSLLQATPTAQAVTATSQLLNGGGAGSSSTRSVDTHSSSTDRLMATPRQQQPPSASTIRQRLSDRALAIADGLVRNPSNRSQQMQPPHRLARRHYSFDEKSGNSMPLVQRERRPSPAAASLHKSDSRLPKLPVGQWFGRTESTKTVPSVGEDPTSDPVVQATSAEDCDPVMPDMLVLVSGQPSETAPAMRSSSMTQQRPSATKQLVLPSSLQDAADYAAATSHAAATAVAASAALLPGATPIEPPARTSAAAKGKVEEQHRAAETAALLLATQTLQLPSEAQPNILPQFCVVEVTIQAVPHPSQPAGSPPLLLVSCVDVSARSAVEALLMQLTESQLGMVSQLFPLHVIEYLTQPHPGPDGGGFGLALSHRSNSGSSSSSNPFSSVVRLHKDVTILFMDVVGFTAMCKEVQPQQVMRYVNKLFSVLDELVTLYGLHKVETAGDSYIVSGGVLSRGEGGFLQLVESHDPATTARTVMACAKDMLYISSMVLMPHNQQPTQVRIGIHTGNAASGLIGSKLPKWSIYGDSINTASRMETTSHAGRIQVSHATHELLPEEQWQPTGGVNIKGKGTMETFLWVAPPQPTAVITLPTLAEAAELTTLTEVTEATLSSEEHNAMSRANWLTSAYQSQPGRSQNTGHVTQLVSDAATTACRVPRANSLTCRPASTSSMQGATPLPHHTRNRSAAAGSVEQFARSLRHLVRDSYRAASMGAADSGKAAGSNKAHLSTFPSICWSTPDLQRLNTPSSLSSCHGTASSTLQQPRPPSPSLQAPTQPLHAASQPVIGMPRGMSGSCTGLTGGGDAAARALARAAGMQIPNTTTPGRRPPSLELNLKTYQALLNTDEGWPSAPAMESPENSAGVNAVSTARNAMSPASMAGASKGNASSQARVGPGPADLSPDSPRSTTGAPTQASEFSLAALLKAANLMTLSATGASQGT